MGSFLGYWDLSEKERAALTTEQVATFTAAELMSKGVLKTSPPVLEPEPTAPTPTETIVRVSGGRYGSKLDVAFRTVDDALAFMALKPLLVERDYVGMQAPYSFSPVPIGGDVSAEKMFSSSDVQAFKADLTKASEVREANKKATEEYEKAVKAEQLALVDMWTDWRQCRSKAARLEKVVETYREYLKIACNGIAKKTEEGDVIAGRFLLKVFSREEIEEAGAWFRVAIVLPPAEPVEEKSAAVNGAVVDGETHDGAEQVF